MATSGVFVAPTSCGLCEAPGSPLFSVPDARRPNDRAPRAVCRFCFLRLVGIAPRQRERVDGAAAHRLPKAPTAVTGIRSGA